MSNRVRPLEIVVCGCLALAAVCMVSAAAPDETPSGHGAPPPAQIEAAGPPTATRPPATTRPAATRPAGATTGSAATQPATSPKPAEPEKPKLVPISFSGAPMNDVARFLTEQLGKPVIISKDVQSSQVTVVNPKPLPKEEAMAVLTTALHEAGVAIEERERTVHLIPIAQVAQSQIKTLGADVDLAAISPTNQIVRRIISVRQADPGKLVEVVKPLLPAYGSVTADPATGKLMVVATVERLMVIESIIRELDAPGSGGGELRVFAIKHVDVFEIVPLLEKLVASYLGVDVKAIHATGGQDGGGPRGMDGPGGPSMRSGGPSGGPSTGGSAVVIKAEKTPVLLIPEPRQSAIVVAAPANVLAQIEIWLAQLDQPKPPSTQNEMIEVQYSDPSELVQQLQGMLNSMPDDSLRNSLRMFPFPSSRKIMLVGSEENRKIIKEWLKEIDIADTGVRITKTFTLKNADAQQIAENIKELFADTQRRYSYYDYYESRSSRGEDRTKVTVTANARNNSVTVVASPEKMSRIELQIKEWDRPLEGREVAPRIYELKYADPEKTKTLLENLFNKKQDDSSFPFRMIFFGYDDEESSPGSPAGRLAGQFRFEAYPDTGKLIVMSKSEDNFKIVDDMIAQIDRPQTCGLPRIIQLKFADAETLAEQLNALLNAPGTPASILRRGQLGTFQDLSERESPFSTNAQRPDQPQRNQQPQQNNAGGVMQFWWQNPPSEMVKTRQPSNLVGKLRIVPNVEQNLLLVAAPEEYAESIELFVRDLDRPGQQVLIKAVIAEIQHDDSTSLGYRFASDPSIFNTTDSLVTDNALKGLFTYSWVDEHDKRNTFTFDLDVTNVLNLLRKVTNLRIKSEPKIFTADNVEAEFFDGQDIPFIRDSIVNGISGQSQSFDYFPVGIRLRVRPHITKERNVDLTVNLLVSSIVPGQTLFGGAIVGRRETTTRIVLQDGKTFLISGILREEDRTITRRVPGLGDIPLLGEVFKHREIVKANTELLIFLTPYVIGPQNDASPVESEPQDRLKQHFPPNLEEQFGPEEPLSKNEARK